MAIIQICHIATDSENPLFQVRNSDGRVSDPVSLTPPAQKKLGKHNDTLSGGLRWYLENFLYAPIDESLTRADDILQTLNAWGQACFHALFDGKAQGWYHAARQSGLGNLTISVTSDDPEVLSWPWEALANEEDGYLAQQCRVERQSSKVGALRPAELPDEQLNILYILSRPYGDGDVGFQSIARPFVDFAAEGRWPVHIDLLRPPTFDRLCTLLREKPNFYHMIHFDGHGGAPGGGDKRFSGQGGELVFEKENDPKNVGEPINAEKLQVLLHEHNVRYFVLNACQSAATDGNGGDPFASVAASLLRAGAVGVAAMSYSLWVSGAKAFVPAFYGRLFETGDIGEATRAGRQSMYRNSRRDTFLGETEFQDWIVPVLYHQGTGEKILPILKPGALSRESFLPQGVNGLSRRDFIGRSDAIQRLERAMRQRQAGILIHGMAGEGKTTLAMGFLKWLDDTGGLENPAIWFNFEHIYSASYVVDTLTGKLFGTQAMALADEEKREKLTRRLREKPFVLVWDNFESVTGYGGIEGKMPEKDRRVLEELIKDLRDGKTKVLITSRSAEEWLHVRTCFRLPLNGLQDEDLWRYVNWIVEDFGFTIERGNAEYKTLVADKLQGNPLAIRAILTRLEKRSVKSLLDDLNTRGFAGGDGDAETQRLLQALAVFDSGLDEAFAPVLRLVGLHEQFVAAGLIEQMLNEMREPSNYIAGCFDMLVKAGLCHEIGEGGYKTHPILRTSLARRHPSGEAERRVFVDCMGMLCQTCDGEALHEQRPVFEWFGANFRNALEMARESAMRDAICALLFGLGNYAYQARHFREAEKQYQAYARAAEAFERPRDQAVAYHQLGVVAGDQRDFDAAEGWYKKSLEIELKQGNEGGAASTYHQLGIVAQKYGDYDNAESWYKQSLEIELKLDNEHGAAITYHQLGTVAQERGDCDAAEDWYKKSLEIELKLDDEYGAAKIYHQLGMVAQKYGDYDAADGWYKKSLEIKLKLDDEHGAVSTYHQLGVVAQERGDHDTAEGWYKKSLEIDLKWDDEYGAALTYHQLGRVAQERGDYDTADVWYKKSLEINLKLGDEHSAAITYHHMGRVSQARGDLPGAARLYRTAMTCT